MADGLTITTGSGATVATDDCGASGHAQIVKLGISTDGSASAIPAATIGGLTVSPWVSLVSCSTFTTTMAGTTANTVLVAPGGAGVKAYVTGIIVANSDTATSCTVAIKDDTTTKLTIPAPKDSGAIVPLATPFAGTANTTTHFACSAVVTNISVTITYFTA